MSEQNELKKIDFISIDRKLRANIFLLNKYLIKIWIHYHLRTAKKKRYLNKYLINREQKNFNMRVTIRRKCHAKRISIEFQILNGLFSIFFFFLTILTNHKHDNCFANLHKLTFFFNVVVVDAESSRNSS